MQGLKHNALWVGSLLLYCVACLLSLNNNQIQQEVLSTRLLSPDWVQKSHHISRHALPGLKHP